MNKPTVPVLCAANSSYTMPLCTMLSSLVDHFDPERDLVVYIFSNDATEKDRNDVRESVRLARPNLERVELHWLSIELEMMKKLPALSGGHLSRDTYARLFAPYLLPERIERAVYLDCDMVVMADVGELYDSTADGSALVHAVHDMAGPFVASPSGVFDYAQRGIPPETRCFNGGVMVIDLKRWRERDLTPPIIDYLLEHGDRIHWGDQGAMNAFLYRDWAPLDVRWNQQTAVLSERNLTACGYSREDWLRAKNEPYIVHYTGPVKPWMEARRHAPRRIFFYDYLRKTVYKNTVPRYPYLEGILGFRGYYRLWKSLGNCVRMISAALPLPGGTIAKFRERF